MRLGQIIWIEASLPMIIGPTGGAYKKDGQVRQCRYNIVSLHRLSLDIIAERLANKSEAPYTLERIERFETNPHLDNHVMRGIA